MQTAYDPTEALLAIPAEALPGEPGLWRPLRAVCAALRIADSRWAARQIPQEHKRRVYKFRRGYRSTAYTYTDLTGVEVLLILRARVPRSVVLDALRAGE